MKPEEVGPTVFCLRVTDCDFTSDNLLVSVSRFLGRNWRKAFFDYNIRVLN